MLRSSFNERELHPKHQRNIPRDEARNNMIKSIIFHYGEACFKIFRRMYNEGSSDGRYRFFLNEVPLIVVK